MPRIPRGQDASEQGTAPEERPAGPEAPPESPTQQMSPVRPESAAGAQAPAISAPEGATVVAPAAEGAGAPAAEHPAGGRGATGDAGTGAADAATGAGAERDAAGTHAYDPRPGFRARTRMRRRLRSLRRLRELAFRDLGGLVFDLHRFGRERADLVQGKLDALAVVDAELRRLEAALRDQREYTDLREAGVAACPRCGAIHDTDASFCPGCGTALGRSGAQGASRMSVAPAEDAPTGTPEDEGTAQPTGAPPAPASGDRHAGTASP